MDPPTSQEEGTNSPPRSNGTSIPGLEDGAVEADFREILKKFSNCIPFLLLLTLRFIVAYITKFFSLLFINTVQYRYHAMFDEQISLKSSANRSILWSLLTFSLATLSLIFLISPLVIGSDVTERLMFKEFKPESSDFISILMLCYFADTTLRLLLGTVKIAVYFVLNPRGNNSTVSLFPNFASCLHLNCMPNLSSFTLQGIINDLISLTPLRSLARRRDSDLDLNSLNEGNSLAADESDIESGPLLSHPGGRRRLVRLSSREGSVTASERDRSSSTSSAPPVLTAEESIEHQTEVMSFMRLKKILSAVDALGTLYRYLMPWPVWIAYFSSGPGTAVLTACYIFFKSFISAEYLVLAFKAVQALVIEKLEFGKYSTAEEIAESGSSTCSICFDSYYRPITLNCDHIFCQHCIHEWLDHENSCPVCRAEVSRDKSSQSIRNMSSSEVPILM